MKPVLNVLLTLTMVAATVALAGQQTMPPSFSEQNEPETVLRAYPLGVATKQAAFSHHGKALRILILPNGKEGWVLRGGGQASSNLPASHKGKAYRVRSRAG